MLDFGLRSFVEWDLKDRFYSQLSRSWYSTQLQLMFRTRRQSGLLFKAQDSHKSQYVLLEVSCVLLCIVHTHSYPIPGSKLTCSTNLFHHSLLAPTWTAFSDYTGPDLLCSTVFIFRYFLFFFILRRAVD